MPALEIPEKFQVTPSQFEKLAFANAESRLELTAAGELIFMPPTGGTAGNKNLRISAQLSVWTDANETGVAFDSSTVFELPNGARRSPDTAWVLLESWNALTLKQQDGFPPIAPDFVIELASPSDLKTQPYEDLQNKMLEYMDNGVRLGWLIVPKTKRVEVYRQGQNVEVLESPDTLLGEEVLPGFELNLKPIL